MKKSRVSVVAVSMLWLLCSCDAPGEGRKAEHAKHLGNEIVRKLNAYQASYQRFPESLLDVGVRLENDDLYGSEGGVKIFYHSSSVERFDLTVKYYGPGSNTCTHRSEMGEGEWECSGAW